MNNTPASKELKLSKRSNRGNSRGAFGEVAPEVRKTMRAFSATGAAASAISVSLRPVIAAMCGMRQLARARGNDGRVAASIARDEFDRSPEDAASLVQLFCREHCAVE